MINERYRNSRIEALILASPEPLAARKIAQIIDDVNPTQVGKAVAEINDGYADIGSSFRIRQLAGGFQFYVLPEYIGLIEELFTRRRKMRLSRAALETVAIIAYRQPATKAEIEHIRGVASDGVIRTLLERNLITITGRAKTVGKPLQYGTTDEFLKLFGLANLDDLPQMAEIEQMITAAESKDQTELTLELNSEHAPVKLNIADGTFDPSQREELEAEGLVLASREGEESSEAEDTETRLVLRRPAETTPDESESEDDLDAGPGEESGERAEVAGAEKDS